MGYHTCLDGKRGCNTSKQFRRALWLFYRTSKSSVNLMVSWVRYVGHLLMKMKTKKANQGKMIATKRREENVLLLALFDLMICQGQILLAEIGHEPTTPRCACTLLQCVSHQPHLYHHAVAHCRRNHNTVLRSILREPLLRYPDLHPRAPVSITCALRGTYEKVVTTIPSCSGEVLYSVLLFE